VRYDGLVSGIVEKYDRNLKDIVFILEKTTGVQGTTMFGLHLRKRHTTRVIIILLLVINITFTAGCIDKGHKDVTFDIWVLKTDADGNLQWTATIDGDPNGRGHEMIQTRDGGYAIAGTGTGPVPRVVTLDGKGNAVSELTFGTPPDYGSSLVEAPDGGYAVASYSGAGVLTRVNESGSVLWSTPLGGGSAWWKVVRAPDGGYAAAGNNRVVRLGEDGTIAWDVAFETNRIVSLVIAVPSGGFVGGGIAGADDDADVWVAMLDADGGIVWNETFAIRSPAELYTVRLSPDGTYDLIYGTTRHTKIETTDMWITETTEISLTADGRLIGEMPVNVSRDIVATEDGGYAFAGFASPQHNKLQPMGYPGSPLRVVRLDGDGMVAWDASFDIGDDRPVISIIQTADGGFAIFGNAYDY